VRWLVDECVDADLVAFLRESGHDVVYMSDVDPRASDVDVLRRAHGENRLVLTEDKDFGDMVPFAPPPGAVGDRRRALHDELPRNFLSTSWHRTVISATIGYKEHSIPSWRSRNALVLRNRNLQAGAPNH
jgi:uncharacterized protein DUF5615